MKKSKSDLLRKPPNCWNIVLFAHALPLMLDDNLYVMRPYYCWYNKGETNYSQFSTLIYMNLSQNTNPSSQNEIDLRIKCKLIYNFFQNLEEHKGRFFCSSLEMMVTSSLFLLKRNLSCQTSSSSKQAMSC